MRSRLFIASATALAAACASLVGAVAEGGTVRSALLLLLTFAVAGMSGTLLYVALKAEKRESPSFTAANPDGETHSALSSDAGPPQVPFLDLLDRSRLARLRLVWVLAIVGAVVCVASLTRGAVPVVLLIAEAGLGLLLWRMHKKT